MNALLLLFAIYIKTEDRSIGYTNSPECVSMGNGRYSEDPVDRFPAACTDITDGSTRPCMD